MKGISLHKKKSLPAGGGRNGGPKGGALLKESQGGIELMMPRCLLGPLQIMLPSSPVNDAGVSNSLMLVSWNIRFKLILIFM